MTLTAHKADAISRIIARLRRRKLRTAYARRQAADAALRDAVWKRNTQQQHEAQRALYCATHEALRLEVRS